MPTILVMKKHLRIPDMKQYFWITFAVFLLALSLDGSGQRRDQRREQQRYDSELYISAVSIHGDIDLSGWSPMKNLSGIRPNVGFKTGFKITPALIVSMDLGLNSQAFQHTLRMEYFMIGDGRSTVSGAVYNRRGMINNYRRFYLYAYAGTGGILSKSKIKDLDSFQTLLLKGSLEVSSPDSSCSLRRSRESGSGLLGTLS